MKRSRLAIAVILSGATFAVIAPSAIPATIAGTNCAKAGTTKTAANIKYTCVKQGSKLVWNKGVAIKPATKITPAPTPAATPTESVKPTPKATPTAPSNVPEKGPTGRFMYRFVGEELQRLNNQGVWRSDDSRAITEFDSIRVAAFAAVRKAPDTKPQYSIIFVDHIAPNYPTNLAGYIKTEINVFSNLMSQYLTENLNVDLVLLTEKDTEFNNDVLPTIIAKNKLGNVLDVLKDYGSIDSFYSRSGSGGGTAGFQEDVKKGYYLGHTSSLATSATYWPEVAPHEMAHVLQFYLAQGARSSCGEGDECGKWHGHLIEGSANAVGMAIAFPNIGWYSDEMDKILKDDIQRYKSQVPMTSESDAVAFFKLIESRDTDLKGSLVYSGGQILWEYYIAKYGFNKWIELYKNLPKTDNFNENLKTTIGIDKNNFYKEAAPYFLSVWKRLA